MARRWPTLAGNHERQVLAAAGEALDADTLAARALDAPARAWLAALPPALVLDDGAIACCHGTPTSDVQYLLETVTAAGRRLASPAEIRARIDPWPQAQVLLCGHSHLPRAVAVDGLLIVNPGSVGRPAYADDHGHPHVVETGSPHARWAVLARTGQGWQVELRATAYDHEAAARRAIAQGLSHWAHQLRTGRARPE